MKKTILFPLALVLFASCGFIPYCYDFSVLDVQRHCSAPESSSPVAATREPDTTATRYRLSDSLVDIRLFITTYQIEFTLKNKTGRTLRVDWEKAAYVNTRGDHKRVIHKGIIFAQKEVFQRPSLVGKGETLSEYLLPSENVNVYLYGSGGWSMLPLFSNPDLGRTAQAIIPVTIDGVMHEYVVRFVIKSV
jgi:hypothetical protein